MVASKSPTLEKRNVGRRPKTSAIGKTRKLPVGVSTFYMTAGGHTDTNE